MQTRFIVIAVMLCVTPSALATWSAKGNFEPDTKIDSTMGYMWSGPDQTNLFNKVYFNAIQGQNIPPNAPTPVSPNLALLGTEFESTPYQAFALLGVWRDCNKDGVIGLGDQGLFEYRTTLLLDDSICKPQSAPVGELDGLVHNDGTWVHEFIPIGYDCPLVHCASNSPNTNHFKVEDAGARVWGDFGLPGAIPGNICWIRPQPPGSLHTIGQIEDRADCYDGSNVGNTIGSGPAQYQQVRALHNPWGEPSDSSDAYVFNCAKPGSPVATVTPPTGQGYTFSVYPPLVPPTAPGPSNPTSGNLQIGGTVNETANAMDDCNRADDGYGAAKGNNEWDAQVAQGPYAPEQPGVTDQKAGQKIQADQQFKFNQGNRNPLGAQVLGATSNQDAGTNTYYSFGIWNTNSLCTTCNQFERGGLNPADPTAQIRVQHQTFYAYVSPTAVSTYGLTLSPTGKSSTYGLEACGTSSTGIHNGWDCDPNDWYKNTDGTSSCTGDASLGPDTSAYPTDNGGQRMCGIVGDPYDLLDVDCFDASVGPARDAGISQGTVTGTGGGAAKC